jgi:N-acetylneuraminic acid mutarotase
MHHVPRPRPKSKSSECRERTGGLSSCEGRRTDRELSENGEQTMTYARNVLAAAVLVGALAAFPSAPCDATAATVVERGYWETLPPRVLFPQPMDECYAVTVDGVIYVLGGLDTRNGSGYEPMGAIWAFNPRSGTWTRKTPMPIPTHHFAITVYRHQIYIFGGFVAPHGTPGWLPVATSWEYDPRAGSWRRLAPAPQARGAGVAVTWKNRMYYLGGATSVPGAKSQVLRFTGQSDQSVGTLESYDPSTNTWKTLAPMPTGRNHFGAAVVDGRIYAIGGRLGSTFIVRSTNTNLVEEYDIARNRWESSTPMPTARSGLSVNVYNDLIFVGGGEYQSPSIVAAYRAFEVFDPASNSWAELPRMPVPRHGFQGAVVGNLLYYVGGDIQSDFEGYFVPTPQVDVYHFPSCEGTTGALVLPAGACESVTRPAPSRPTG